MLQKFQKNDIIEITNFVALQQYFQQYFHFKLDEEIYSQKSYVIIDIKDIEKDEHDIPFPHPRIFLNSIVERETLPTRYFYLVLPLAYWDDWKNLKLTDSKFEKIVAYTYLPEEFLKKI